MPRLELVHQPESSPEGAHSEVRTKITPRPLSSAPPSGRSEGLGWLDAHVDLAASVTALEALVMALPDSAREPAARVAKALEDIGEVRDALYEVYCDAADERVGALTSPGAPLNGYVKALYFLCDGALDALTLYASALRTGDADDALVAASLVRATRRFTATVAGTVERIPDAVDATLVGPELEAARANVESMIAAGMWLETNLMKLFV